MLGDRALVYARLRSVAAQAETLAHDCLNGKLWPGELGKRAAQIREELEATIREAPRGW